MSSSVDARLSSSSCREARVSSARGLEEQGAEPHRCATCGCAHMAVLGSPPHRRATCGYAHLAVLGSARRHSARPRQQPPKVLRSLLPCVRITVRSSAHEPEKFSLKKKKKLLKLGPQRGPGSSTSQRGVDDMSSYKMLVGHSLCDGSGRDTYVSALPCVRPTPLRHQARA